VGWGCCASFSGSGQALRYKKTHSFTSRKISDRAVLVFPFQHIASLGLPCVVNKEYILLTKSTQRAVFPLTRKTLRVVLMNMGTRYRGIALQVFGHWWTGFPLVKMGVSAPKKCLLMKSPIFFSKGRTVRFWIQIVLVLSLVRIALVPSALYANPTGEQVVGGAAGFNRPDAATLIVNQNTDRAVINWNSFSIANGELTRFVQPSSSSAVLNRVVTANPSAIYGTLQANGNVFLINPGGVLVGAGGVVNTASFVASTHDINTDEFMKGGQLNFKGNSDASVINQGNITAREGDVFLIAKEVKNEGQLMAKDGTVGMVSGTEVSLQAVGQGNYKVRLMAAEKPMTENGGQKTEGSAEIVNEGVIQAANAVLEAKGSYLPMAIKNTGVIEATGLVENGDGSVTLTGGEGDILNTGVVAALQRSLDGQRETGGSIMMTAKNVTSDIGSLITASGKDGGGVVKLRSADTTILRGSIEVVGASESAKGGKVQLLGERVGMFESAKVDASGGAGGGEVLVGGDYLGKNPNVPNAKAVVMTSDSAIRANATENGDGGKVILWSDEYTAFYGEIFARGGIEGGNGGFVETSSKDNLQAFGAVNASAVNGQGGLWLLDPANVQIATATSANGSFDGEIPNVFTPNNTGSATASSTTIQNSLNAGTSVTILTGVSTAGQPGNITQAASGAITMSGVGDATLTMIAAGSINITQNITSSGGALSLVLGGRTAVTIGATITTRGGDITIQGASADGASLAGSAGSFKIDTNGAVNTGLGNLKINATSAVNQLVGTTLLIGGTTSITTDGNITLAQPLNDFSTVVINSGATVSLQDEGAINMGAITTSGDFTLTSGLTSGGTTNLNGAASVGGSYTANITDVGNINASIVAVGSVSIVVDGALSVNAGVTSRTGSVTLTGGAGTGDINIDNAIIGGNGGTINLFSPDGSITINASISAFSGTLATVNLTTGSTTSNGGFISQTGGTITTETLNAQTFSNASGAYIYLGSQNVVDFISLRTLTRLSVKQAALIYYRDFDGFDINGFGIRTASNVTLRGGTTSASDIGQINPATVEALGLGIVTGGSVVLADTTNDILNLAVNLSNPGDGGPGDLSYTDANGFNVAFVTTNFTDSTLTDTTTKGIRADDVLLIAEDGTQADTGHGIRLRNTPGDRTEVTAGTQYLTLGGLATDSPVSPGHIESAGNVTIIVREPVVIPTDRPDNRFTLDEGIHLFAGMDSDLAGFDNTRVGSHGIVTILANNMVIGMDTDPNLAMHGLIMTQDINQADTINTLSGVFLAPYGSGVVPSLDRAVQIVSAKADYDDTPDPGFFQLTNGELNRINTSRLQISSAFPDPAGVITPAIDVRSSLSMNGLYDISTIATGSGLFPNTPGVNRLELWASGGSRSDVQVSADISSDATSTTSTTPTPMQIFLSAAVAGNGSQGGVVNVNAGLRSNGGSIAIQGDNVNINGLINANSPNNADLLGLVALFPAQTDADVNLGSKVGVGTLGILRDEVALITAGTVQIGITFLSPKVLQPTNPFTETFLSGSNPLWQIGDLDTLAGVNTGTLTVSDLIADLSINTLALLADDSTGSGTALSQANNNAGIKVAGLLIGGAPGTAATAAPGTDYILNSTLNEFDRFAVALTTTLGQDGTGAGAPTGDLLLVNSKGLVGGNSGEVARTGQQWDQGLIRANVNTAPLYTGVGLVVARALSITAAGPVSIFETLPAGVAGVGQYMGHVSANPNSAVQMDRTEVGNEIGALGGSGTTVGLAVDATQNTPGSSGANNVWAAAARGLAISDLSGVISGAVDGILTNGGSVTLEGNAIEIAPDVARTTGGTITIDTTGDGIAPSGGRVVIRPATGQNGFQDRLGSGAYDPNLQNSILAGAPVEMNLGTGSTTVTAANGSGLLANPLIDTRTGAITGYTILNGGSGYTTTDAVTNTGSGSGATGWTVVAAGGVVTGITGGAAGTGYGGGFLDTSLDTIWIGSPSGSLSLFETAIRASAIEIGQNSIAGTAAGKITVSDALAFDSLTQSLNLSSKGAVETADNLAGGDTITLAGGLAVQSVGAVALRGNVDIFAVDTSGGTQSVRFIDSNEITIGNVDGVSGILGGSVFLEAGGNIAQSDGATIQATALGLRATGGSIRLDQSNDFSLVAATADGDVYLKTGFGLSVSQVAAGAPGGTPAAVAGISGANVTLVTGGTITQDGNAPVTATGAFLATVAEGSSVSLDSSSNNFAQAPLVAALTSTGGLGLAADVTIVNSGGGGIILGQAGILTVELLSSGSGYTSRPTVGFSVGGVSTAGTAAAILGLGTITVSSGGAGYLSSPVVTITGGGGVGATALAVVDSNPLSTTYGQVTGITVTNPGTGYTTLPTVTLAGGSPAQPATVTGGTAASLLLQRINVSNSGIAQSYTANPKVTLSGGGATSQGTATATVGGVAGYLPSSSTSILGGITGNLSVINSGGGNFTDGTGFSVDGTSTFGSTGAITLDSSANYMLGTITVGSDSSVTINNSISSILGNFTGVDDTTGVPDGTALVGPLTLGSMGSIYQGTSGGFLSVNGSTTFLATSTALAGGTANGAVIINNASNIFVGSVTATGTRVVIRNSDDLNLGAVTASTSLAATSTGNFTQSGAINVTGTGASAINASGTVTLSRNSSFGGDLSVISTDAGPATTINQGSGVLTVTGNSTFTAAGGNSINVGQANTFTGTVSFAASSGNLANITVQDTTALVLGGLTLGAGGDLSVTAAGITQSGAFVVPGTITLAAGTANNITLNNPDNNFGTVVVTSGNNVVLRGLGDVILSGPSVISGNFSLTAGGNITDDPGTALSITGLATFNAGTFNVTLGDNLGDTTNFGSLNLTGGTVTVTEDSAMVLAGVNATTLNLTSSGVGGGITQTGSMIVTGASGFTSNTGTSVILGNTANQFTGLVTFTGTGGNLTDVTLYNQLAINTQPGGLSISGALTLTSLVGINFSNIGANSLTATSGGDITDSNGAFINITGLGTFNAGANSITLGDNGGDVTAFGSLNLSGGTVTVSQDSAMVLTGVNATTLNLTSSGVGGGITQTGSMIVTGTSGFTSNTGTSVILGNTANQFTGQVTFTGTGGNLTDVTLNNQSAYSVQSGGLNLSGNLAVTANGISQAGAITISGTTGTTTLNGGTGTIALINSGNTYASTVTVLGGASADMFFRVLDEADLGAVKTSGTFTLRTADNVSFNIANGASAGFDVTSNQLSSFNVGTFAPIAKRVGVTGGDLYLGALTSYPGIGSISLTTVGGGDINGSGAISMNTLQLNSSGTATFSAVNQIKNLGNVSVASGGLTLRNGRGLNLTGTVSMPQRFSLEVAGQFYNQTGSATPLAAVQGGSVVKSLSLMGGLPNQVSGLAGFSYRYDGQMPTSGNVMSYAVSPLTMFAPGGTTIAGVDLSGTQTGGGQFNTFLTGSDNLNWMISDFGRFDLPTVKPSGMNYILYPQRVEPETKTLPAATLGQLERELGRPPTLDEIQAREVAVREAAMVRSGAILERSSFDAVEDEVDKKESAEVPVQVIDGGKPQADARGQRSEDGVQKAEVGSRQSAGVGPQARKTQSVKQGANGPILRSGPIRSVAQLRPAEPSQSGNISEASAQALKLDAKSVIEQERASAEVGIAPPIASGR